MKSLTSALKSNVESKQKLSLVVNTIMAYEQIYNWLEEISKVSKDTIEYLKYIDC